MTENKARLYLAKLRWLIRDAKNLQQDINRSILRGEIDGIDAADLTAVIQSLQEQEQGLTSKEHTVGAH